MYFLFFHFYLFLSLSTSPRFHKDSSMSRPAAFPLSYLPLPRLLDVRDGEERVLPDFLTSGTASSSVAHDRSNIGFLCQLAPCEYFNIIGPNRAYYLFSPYSYSFLSACFFGLTSSEASSLLSFLSRIAGNKITSRKLAASVKSMTRRSIPIPQPAAGGMPYSRASI